MKILLVLAVVTVATVAAHPSGERCSESLVLKPLAPDGKRLLAHFRFECTKVLRQAAPPNLEMPRDFNVFPRSIGQLVASTGVESFRLSLARSRWDPRWGEPVLSDGTSIGAPNGAELVASFRSPSASVDSSWKTLANGLAGLLCNSLNFVAKPGTFSSPAMGGMHVHPAAFASGNATTAAKNHVRYAALGRETVCTENLTPWQKLLPCGSHSGLAARISPETMFGARHHVLAMEVDSEDIEGGRTMIRVVQTLSAVLQTRGEVLAPEGDVVTWTSASLLQSSPSSACPGMDTDTVVHFDLPHGFDKSDFSRLSPFPSEMAGVLSLPKGLRSTSRNPHSAVVELRQSIPQSQGIGQAFVDMGSSSQAPIQASRFLLDLDGVATTLVTRVENLHPSTAWMVLLHEAVPWWLRVYFHTLNVTVDGVPVLSSASVWHSHITPAVDRRAMAQIELGLKIPANSSTVISISCTKQFMRQADFPPDVSRGLDLPAVTITYQDIGGTLPPARLYTESLLVPMPFPDFSMPFNVITYVSTLVALFLGSMISIVSVREKPKGLVEPPGLAARIKSAVSRMLGKKPDSSADKHEKTE